MNRYDNVTVFNDTESLCKSNPKLRDSVRNSIRTQKLICEADKIPKADINKYDTAANVVVSAKRTYQAALEYKGSMTAVLNFASATNPGGGVVRGAGAQEECLCRCSTLYFCLNTSKMWDGFYGPHRETGDPLHNDDIIYTPDVCVFKSDTDMPRLLSETDWYNVDVISCAAPNLREKPANRYNSGDGTVAVRITDRNLQTLHEKRLRRILDVAACNGAETVILGAFGCGAFMNDPKVVAEASKNVITNYLHVFKNVEFAVYCRPGDDSNYRIFREKFI